MITKFKIFENFADDTFPNIKLKYKVGDYVILLKNDTSNASLNMHFKVDDMYIISDIDEHIFDINDLPYDISHIYETNISAWVNEYQIRKATEEEIDQNKYNL